MSVSKLVGAPHPYHTAEEDIAWGDYRDWYPEGSMPGMRAKRIIGPGGAIEHDETVFGILELDPGADYPAHRHPAPEVYFVIEGEAECTWGEETFVAKAGSTIRTPPNEWHAFRNIGQGVFRAVAYWWAPGGNTEETKAALELKNA